MIQMSSQKLGNLQAMNPAEKEMGIIPHMMHTMQMTTEIALDDIKRIGKVQFLLKSIKKSKTTSKDIKNKITVVEGEVKKAL